MSETVVVTALDAQSPVLMGRLTTRADASVNAHASSASGTEPTRPPALADQYCAATRAGSCGSVSHTGASDAADAPSRLAERSVVEQAVAPSTCAALAHAAAEHTGAEPTHAPLAHSSDDAPPTWTRSAAQPTKQRVPAGDHVHDALRPGSSSGAQRML
jgi:hypothetical protein